jgi:hypothetical protein
MPDKSPHHAAKKPAKSIKEKRADKKASESTASDTEKLTAHKKK